MDLREALIQQSPSLALQRQAQAEIARLDAMVHDLRSINSGSCFASALTLLRAAYSAMTLEESALCESEKLAKHQLLFLCDKLASDYVPDDERTL